MATQFLAPSHLGTVLHKATSDRRPLRTKLRVPASDLRSRRCRNLWTTSVIQIKRKVMLPHFMVCFFLSLHLPLSFLASFLFLIVCFLHLLPLLCLLLLLLFLLLLLILCFPLCFLFLLVLQSSLARPFFVVQYLENNKQKIWSELHIYIYNCRIDLSNFLYHLYIYIYIMLSPTVGIFSTDRKSSKSQSLVLYHQNLGNEVHPDDLIRLFHQSWSFTTQGITGRECRRIPLLPNGMVCAQISVASMKIPRNIIV